MKIIPVLAALAIMVTWGAAAFVFGYPGFLVGALIMTAVVGVMIVWGTAG